MKTEKWHARDLAYCGISAAIIAVCSWVTVPGTVPFTLQTFAVFTVLGLLGGRRGTLAVAVYLALGLAGVPVFSGFGAGPGVLLGPTGGYLVGFLWMGLICMAAEKGLPERKWTLPAALLAGLVACYAFGTAWFMTVFSRRNGPVALGTALGWCVLPFIIPDLLKLAVALVTVRRLKHRIPGC